MLAFSNDYYGFIFRVTQSVELFCTYFAEGYPSPLCVEITTDAGNYLSKEASAIIAETEEVRGDIENYDIATHMINTVRQALQGIAMGSSIDDVGKTIVDLIAEYE